MPEQALQPTTTTSTATPVTSGPSVEPDAQDLLGNAAVAEMLANTTPQAVEPTLTGIVHVGLNKYAHDEAAALQRFNSDKGGVRGIRDSKEQGVLSRDGTRYDLEDEAQRAAFVARLGLETGLAKRVEEFIAAGGGAARDELGQLVETYLEAERGTRRMDRVVLSGHSVGDQIWGDDNGEIPFESFIELATLFPKAAAQVKHLMVSACYTGSESNVSVFQRMFPSLESLMAYSGSSPGTWSGAMDHMGRWEKATEDGDGTDVEGDIAKGLRKASNVATWNVQDGYQGEDRMDVRQVESELASQDAVYQRYYSGQEVVSNAQSGPLRDYYNLLQRAIGHPELDSGVVEQLRDRRDITIRLLYWPVVAARFAVAYHQQLADGYAEAGRAAPDFKTLTRAGALTEADALAAMVSGAASTRAHELVQKGLVQLDETIIPTAWV